MPSSYQVRYAPSAAKERKLLLGQGRTTFARKRKKRSMR